MAYELTIREKQKQPGGLIAVVVTFNNSQNPSRNAAHIKLTLPDIVGEPEDKLEERVINALEAILGEIEERISTGNIAHPRDKIK